MIVREAEEQMYQRGALVTNAEQGTVERPDDEKAALQMRRRRLMSIDLDARFLRRGFFLSSTYMVIQLGFVRMVELEGPAVPKVKDR